MKFSLKGFILGISIAAVLGCLMHYFFGLGFLPALGISVAAILINGVIATIDDEMPDGFNNPDTENEQASKKTSQGDK